MIYGGSGRRWRGPKPMVTPVHRFQPVECVNGQYPHSHIRRPNRQLYIPQSSFRLEGVPARSHSVELDSSVFLDLPIERATEEHVVIPELEPVGRVKCGIWACFSLATVVIIGAKLYFNNKDTLEVLVFAALMVIFLLVGCTVSLCRSKSTRDLLSAAVTGTVAYGPGHPTTLQVTDPGPLPQTAAPAPEVAPEPPPPPYHIAILLPQQLSPEEVPPPSYDKAVS